ncbi:hypothetical protein HDF15_000981 [Granulicella mallensis]|uniref:Uncharacterized protein n=1 Tax=Granulicella mallensis TaxID=940614 RepID=A0A7W7ZNY3_9BACT|nr:hypothetical protein [Granulicella mallensis]
MGGKPVGSLTVTKSGVTRGGYSSNRRMQNGNVTMSASVTVNGSENRHELRAGLPGQFRIVGIDSSEKGHTKFKLIFLALPKAESSR